MTGLSLAQDRPKSMSSCRQRVDRGGLHVPELGMWPLLSMGFCHFFAIVSEYLLRIRQYRLPSSRLGERC